MNRKEYNYLPARFWMWWSLLGFIGNGYNFVVATIKHYDFITILFWVCLTIFMFYRFRIDYNECHKTKD